MTHADGFRHQALLYAGEDDFVRRATPFLRAGVDSGDAMLVVVGDRKIDRLRAALDGDADGIEFADMAGAGRNPARIIPLWRDFVEQNEAAPGLRGIGEPIYPERDADALVECQHHESLLNVAFDGERAFTLVCPYDTRSLGRAVVAEARRSHPYVDDGHAHSSDRYRGYDASARLLDAPLPEPPASALVMPFAHDVLRALRTLVAGRVADLGVTRERGEGFVLAVHELATNSVLYGGGRGVLRLWSDASSVVADVSDSGRIEDPLAGRVLPHPSAERGRGLWLANQFCDLVQIRAYRDGGVVRVRLDL